jgi:hypothetical protein
MKRSDIEDSIVILGNASLNQGSSSASTLL